MTLLHEAVESKKFDVRVAERNIQRGFINADDYQKAVKALPDDADNAEYVEINSLLDQDDSVS